MARLALLIGVSDYEPGLEPLPSAVRDVIAMQEVLAHPELGGFAAEQITVLKNPDRQTMEDRIYRLFAQRQRDDLVLLYFSGHGVVDDSGEFYFTTRSTRKEAGRLVPTTAVAARPVLTWMEQSRSQRQVIVLDCCFSGAFAKGAKAKDSGSVNLEQFLGGKGRAILTASTSTQYALAQDGFDLSVYTHYLVEGIRNGGADLDNDGFIGVEELHAYARGKVKEAAPAMTPEFYPVRDGYKILLAKSPKDDPKLQYRKAVEARAHQGRFSIPARRLLNSLREQLGLTLEIATHIEAEVLQPYRDYQRKLQEYEHTLLDALQVENPLSARTIADLKDYQQHLALLDQDIAPIEAKYLALAPSSPEADQGSTQAIEETPSAPESTSAESQPHSPEAESHQSEAIAPEDAQTWLEFEVVILNERGQEDHRQRGRAQVLVEDLGAGVTLEMVAVPAGEGMMGTATLERSAILREYLRHGAAPPKASEWTSWELPQHPITVERFWMGQAPITQAQWRQVACFPKVRIDLNPDPAYFKGAMRPVERVSWVEAVEFCDRLSQHTGKHYRLPSEAEWEYACRSGTRTPFHFGATLTSAWANCDGTYPFGRATKGEFRQQTTEVGLFPPNLFGLYDLHGNVWEWCADPWHASYVGAPTSGAVWLEAGHPTDRVIRGGSWSFHPVLCRSASRDYGALDHRVNGVGFRVVSSGMRV
jgi:formylglycine-generating enzyme required for sulfatase activity